MRHSFDKIEFKTKQTNKRQKTFHIHLLSAHSFIWECLSNTKDALSLEEGAFLLVPSD